jgi:tellurite resistance-related uncharacterized protein
MYPELDPIRHERLCDSRWLRSGHVLRRARRSGMPERLDHDQDAMPALPEGVVQYKQTPEFDEQTLTSGLRSRHTLKPGTWGRIVVLEGTLLYVIEQEPSLSFELTPARPGIVAPEAPHHVEPHGKVRLRIEFYR